MNTSENFLQKEFTADLQHLKPRKAPGSDSICQELIPEFSLTIPDIWKTAFIVMIPKPMKPVGDLKSYRPISLPYVPYHILKRLICARVKSIINPLLYREQAVFRRGKFTVDEVVRLTQNIEDFLEAKKNAGALFVDLKAAYDTVWHRGIICKLLRFLPDKQLSTWSEQLGSLSKTEILPLLPVTASKQEKKATPSRKRPSSGSFLAPLLFNTYTYNFSPQFPKRLPRPII